MGEKSLRLVHTGMWNVHRRFMSEMNYAHHMDVGVWCMVKGSPIRIILIIINICSRWPSNICHRSTMIIVAVCCWSLSFNFTLTALCWHVLDITLHKYIDLYGILMKFSIYDGTIVDFGYSNSPSMLTLILLFCRLWMNENRWWQTNSTKMLIDCWSCTQLLNVNHPPHRLILLIYQLPSYKCFLVSPWTKTAWWNQNLF